MTMIKRRMKNFGLLIGDTYSDIADAELDVLIKEKISQNPNCGYRRMHGFLIADNCKVSERRILSSMHRVDPEGMLTRALQLNTIARREYKVPGVLALWHIDGHHKLIRFVLVHLNPVNRL